MSLFQTALTTLYPPRCLACGDLVNSDFGLCGTCWGQTPFLGGAQCRSCAVPLPGVAGDDDLFCDQCMRHPKAWDRACAAVAYQGVARKLVLALKHGGREEIAQPAARWMHAACAAHLTAGTLIVPVPLHWRRTARRRYNQSALMARALSRISGHDWCPDLLQRLRATPSLDGRSRTERHDILRGSITVHPRRRHRISARSVLLVDDVMTTGATLAAATEACRAAGTGSVTVCVLARALGSDYVSGSTVKPMQE